MPGKSGGSGFSPMLPVSFSADLAHAATGFRLMLCADPRIRLFLPIGLATGARLAAILELTWHRVDLEQRIIDLRSPHPLAPQAPGGSPDFGSARA
jgi:hypothetical protein